MFILSIFKKEKAKQLRKMENDNTIHDECLRRVLHVLEAMKRKLQTPWSFKRSENLKKLIHEKWSELGSLESALHHAAGITIDKVKLIKPVYDDNDLCRLLVEKLCDERLRVVFGGFFD